MRQVGLTSKGISSFGIRDTLNQAMDSRFRGNDEDGGGMPVSFRDTSFPGCMDSRFLHAFARMTEDDGRLAGCRPGSRGMTGNDGE